jgi:hypothetical protein
MKAVFQLGLVRQAVRHRHLADDEVDQCLGEAGRNALVVVARDDDDLADPRLQAQGDADGGFLATIRAAVVVVVERRAACDNLAALVHHPHVGLEHLGRTRRDRAGDPVETCGRHG